MARWLITYNTVIRVRHLFGAQVAILRGSRLFFLCMLAGLLLPKGFNPWLLHPFPRQSAKDTIGAKWSTGGKCARLAVLTPRRPGELFRPQNVSYG